MSAPWLAQLAPDHAPSAAGWWPPALGWWAVAGLAILTTALAVSVVRWWREPRRRLRRAALRELRRIRASGVEGPAAARAIENLLRRHAIALHGRERAARLAGQAWLDFAGAAGGAAFAGETGRSLLAAAFGGGASGASDSAAGRGPADGHGARAVRDRWLAAAAQLIRRSEPERAPSGRRAASGERA